MSERPRRRRRTTTGGDRVAAVPLTLPPEVGEQPPAAAAAAGDASARWWWWGGTGLNLLAGVRSLQTRVAAGGSGTVGCVVSSAARPAASAQRYAHLERLLAAAAPPSTVPPLAATERRAAIADVPVGTAALVWERCCREPSRRTLRCPNGDSDRFWQQLARAVGTHAWVVVPLYLVGQYPVVLQRAELLGLHRRTAAEVDECHVTLLLIDRERKRYELTTPRHT